MHKSNEKMQKSNIHRFAISIGRHLNALLEEIDKMWQLFKPQTPGDLRYIPVGTPQQGPRLLDNPIGNEPRGRLPRHLLQGTIEMIDMHGQLTRKLHRLPEPD